MKKLIAISMVALTIACSPGQETYTFDEMTYTPGETVFRLFAPADATCSVRLGTDSLPMTLGADSIWTVTAPGDHKGETYEFVVNGQASPGVFAKAVTVNGQKGVVVDMKDSDPVGWEADRRPAVASPADLVVYELHHRDFSIARPDAQHPGKFLALTEPWAIDHLQQLGVNAVHILPSYDFGSVDETRLDEPQYNWGYDPVNYNVPEGSYSTDPTDPLCRVREFKQMVQALHRAGIRVILDVVYNHTYDIEHSNFQRTYPDYYYRKVRVENGELRGMITSTAESDTTSAAESNHTSQFSTLSSQFSNGSGCGNETASEQPMMRRFMIESVKYWVREYHIDGFRFDLMGCHDIATMNAIRQELTALDPSIFVYGEGWSAGQCALPTEQLGVKANVAQMPGIAAFSDELRDALRGPFDDDKEEGWLGRCAVTGCEADMNIFKESIKAGIAGMIEHPQVDYTKVNYTKEPWALEPTQMMSYVSCHDDMCLVDRLLASVLSRKANHTSQFFASKANKFERSVLNSQLKDELIRLHLLAHTAVFTSQGVPFMLSGEELLRTKQGVHNSYNAPDSINRLDWKNKDRYPQVFEYLSALIALRKHHPAFRLGSADLVRRHLEFLPAPDTVVAFRLKDNAGGDPWRDIIVILNSETKAVDMTIPEGSYIIVCRNGAINEEGMGEVLGSKVTVDPQSALILYD